MISTVIPIFYLKNSNNFEINFVFQNFHLQFIKKIQISLQFSPNLQLFVILKAIFFFFVIKFLINFRIFSFFSDFPSNFQFLSAKFQFRYNFLQISHTLKNFCSYLPKFYIFSRIFSIFHFIFEKKNQFHQFLPIQIGFT